MGVLPDWMVRQAVKIEPHAPEAKRLGVISYGVTSYGYDARVGYRFKIFTPVFGSVVDPKDFDEKCFAEIDQTPRGHDVRRHAPTMRDSPVWRCQACGAETPYTPPDKVPDEYALAACPKRPQPSPFVQLPPHSFALAETVERFEIPRDVLAICVGKSTYARCGIIVNVTPLEPEWRGRVTVEISNTSDLPARVYCGEGIMQIVFLRTDGVEEALLNAVRRLTGQQMQLFASGRHEQGADAVPGYLRWIEEQLHAELGSSACLASYADKRGGEGGKYQDQPGLTLPKVDE